MDIPTLPTTRRILYDVPCAVCEDHSSGKHYGVHACDGCAGFFKRSVRRQRSYDCKTGSSKNCVINKTYRNQCRACRLAKCESVGMNREAVQHERGPRMSTINRQLALFANQSRTSVITYPTSANAELVVKPPLPPPPPLSYAHHPSIMNPFQFNGIGLPFSSLVPMSPRFSSVPVTVKPMTATDTEIICEIAAKLLFIGVSWAKDILKLLRIDIASQQHRLLETWKDIYVLGCGQYMYPMDLRNFIPARNINIDMAGVELLRTAISRIGHLCLDSVEFMYLRALILLMELPRSREGEPTLESETASRIVAEHHDINKNILHMYVDKNHPQSDRWTSLLELLPLISRVSSATIVDLFFRPTIGGIAIESVICDMYNTT